MNTAAMAPPRVQFWRVLLGLAVFQAAWFACVGFAAMGRGDWGVAAVCSAVALHLAWSDDPATDAVLVAIAVATGIVWDTAAIQAGWIHYASPGDLPGIAPAWILALWALFATTLREPLRWMHGRPFVAALFGAVGGPLSYAAAARMGACRFDDATVSVVALGAGWALMTPLLVGAARTLQARRATRGVR